MNGEIVYTLTSNDFFELEQYSDQVGSHLDLVPKKSLDREKTETVNLKLHAANPNKKEFVTSIPILIRVLDQNEHAPTFSKKVNLKNVMFFDGISKITHRSNQFLSHFFFEDIFLPSG